MISQSKKLKVKNTKATEDTIDEQMDQVEEVVEEDVVKKKKI